MKKQVWLLKNEGSDSWEKALGGRKLVIIAVRKGRT